MKTPPGPGHVLPSRWTGTRTHAARKARRDRGESVVCSFQGHGSIAALVREQDGLIRRSRPGHRETWLSRLAFVRRPVRDADAPLPLVETASRPRSPILDLMLGGGRQGRNGTVSVPCLQLRCRVCVQMNDRSVPPPELREIKSPELWGCEIKCAMTAGLACQSPRLASMNLEAELRFRDAAGS